MIAVPFNRPTIAPNEESYVLQAIQSGRLSGDGPFTQRASRVLSEIHNGSKVLLTTSCTSALEMAGLLLDIGPGDEVIVPSFTFVSSANAFVLHGATVVFAEVDPATLNIKAESVAPLVNKKTKAIVTVNYGGYPSVTDDMLSLSQERGIPIIEDNAHGLFGASSGAALGTRSSISTLSFHETKNITCGEGGAIVVNDDSLRDRAEVIREKGTNRSQFFRGMVDKYTWTDKGSSYLMSEINAALLLSQLEFSSVIQQRRRNVFQIYMKNLREWASVRGANLPLHLDNEDSPCHLFPILMSSLQQRTLLIEKAQHLGVSLAFHYVPLHSSPAGQRFGRTAGPLAHTEQIADTLVRLPLYSDMTEEEAERVLAVLLSLQD